MALLHESTFKYLQPDNAQKRAMDDLRTMFASVSQTLEHVLPDGADRTYILRKLREVAMWANVSITRHADGSPRRAIDDVVDYPPGHPAPGDLGSTPL